MLLKKILVSVGVLVVAGAMGTVALASGASPDIDLGGAPRIEVTGGPAASLLPHMAMLPGDTITTNRKVIYHGAHAPSTLGLQVSNYASRALDSDAHCTAPDPASKVTLRISLAAAVLYSGSLADFASRHGSAATMLTVPGPWRPNQPNDVAFVIGLDHSAGNDYQGCQSTADVSWLAS